MSNHKWIKYDRANGWTEWTDLKCPVCGETFENVPWPRKWKCCPVCTTKLCVAEEIPTPRTVSTAAVHKAIRDFVKEVTDI